MYKYLVLLLLFYPVICKTSDGIVPPETIKNIGVPPIEQEIATDMAKYMELKGTSFITWKDNKQMIVAYRKSNTYQLFTLDKPMGEREQITDFDEPVSNAIVNPDPLVNDLLFQKDSGGDEQHQIFSLNVSNGVSKLLTDGKSKHQAVTFSHDGKQIAFSDNSRTGKYFDVYTMDPNNPETRKLVYKATHSAYLTPAWSRDAGKLLVREYISASEVASHLLDLRTGKATNLTPNSAESIFFSLTDFTANDEFVIGLSNQGTEFRKLIRMHLATGEVSIISNNINWDVSGFTLDRNGNKGIFIVNENGFSRLYQFNTENFSTQSLPFGEGIITSAEYTPMDRNWHSRLITHATIAIFTSLTWQIMNV